MTSRGRVALAVVISALGVLVLEVAVVLIFVYSGQYNVAASQPHTKLVHWLLNTTMERSVEQHAGGVQSPGQASVAEGASHFAEMCVVCHGAPGVHPSEIGQGLNPMPPELSEAAADWGLEEVYWIVKHGIKMTGMPAFGPIDIWINNAMTTVFAPFTEMTPEEFHRVTEVTYLGYVYGTMAALKRMFPRNRGVIVQVGSALSDRSIPLQSAYCGAKHGIRGFTDSIRCELIHYNSNVHITMVQMPALNTPQFNWCRSKMPRRAQPVPPIYQPEIGADAIVFAATHRRREIYVGLPTVEAMWGNKFAAGWIDKYLARTNFDAQQTGEPEDPNRPDNLHEPAPGDFAAHGRFDRRSRDRSIELWASEHIGFYKGVAGIAVLAGALVLGAITATKLGRSKS